MCCGCGCTLAGWNVSRCQSHLREPNPDTSHLVEVAIRLRMRSACSIVACLLMGSRTGHALPDLSLRAGLDEGMSCLQIAASHSPANLDPALGRRAGEPAQHFSYAKVTPEVSNRANSECVGGVQGYIHTGPSVNLFTWTCCPQGTYMLGSDIVCRVGLGVFCWPLSLEAAPITGIPCLGNLECVPHPDAGFTGAGRCAGHVPPIGVGSWGRIVPLHGGAGGRCKAVTWEAPQEMCAEAQRLLDTHLVDANLGLWSACGQVRADQPGVVSG